MGEWGQGGGGSPGVERERKKREEWGQIGEGRLVVVVLVVLVVGGMRAPVPTPANPEVKQ